MKKFFSILILFFMVVVFGNFGVKNVIYFIGDGMGINHLVLASLLEGKTLNIMKSPFVGYVTTYSANSLVTDSAAAGTALATGFKTNNGMIGMLPDGTIVPTIFEIVSKYGMKTGIVVTCRVTHATPGAFYGHVKTRKDEKTLANQLLNSKLDVVMGGGWKYFDEKIVSEKGFDYIKSKSELANYTGDKLLALFSDSHLNAASERTDEQPMLYEMVEKALCLLSKDEKPFFLMVEGSQIDWEAHGNDVYGVWKEVMEFDKAVEVALKFLETHPNTLIVITSDHETGGLGLSTGEYSLYIDIIKGYKKTADWIMKNYDVNNEEEFRKTIKRYFNVELSDKEIQLLKQTKNSSNPYKAASLLGRILSEKALVGWTTYKHTAAPVPIFAFGPGAENFNGFMDNTDIPRIISRLLGYSLSREF
ncbi:MULTISPECIES: alkaline phosphatase [unclassified Thermosipho (in: thermotogales)]|uniref:alkaline phosphatase n=1 Tax=unclassified Thermosipho (in: thermotogales) TaxID=2676525 RepID=UPI000984805C|nr:MULTISPECIES: alkaline phosphatase [unclassified Thermosipho (in: thermotogales)]MBT1248424.1 alkaline phosphatase [Thermosipho sp. 1244]OOC47551.1 alkaline phosphatase [Thermosipho sp. 1223]